MPSPLNVRSINQLQLIMPPDSGNRFLNLPLFNEYENEGEMETREETLKEDQP